MKRQPFVPMLVVMSIVSVSHAAVYRSTLGYSVDLPAGWAPISSRCRAGLPTAKDAAGEDSAFVREIMRGMQPGRSDIFYDTRDPHRDFPARVVVLPGTDTLPNDQAGLKDWRRKLAADFRSKLGRAVTVHQMCFRRVGTRHVVFVDHEGIAPRTRSVCYVVQAAPGRSLTFSATFRPGRLAEMYGAMDQMLGSLQVASSGEARHQRTRTARRSPALPKGWTPYVSQEGGYRVGFPRPPKAMSRTVGSGPAKLRVIGAAVEFEGRAYLAMYADWNVPGLAGVSTEKMLDAWGEGLVSSLRNATEGVKGTPLHQRDITMSGSPGRELVFMLDARKKVVMKIRICAARRRLYSIGAGYEQGSRAHPDLNTFLDSFQLLKPGSAASPTKRAELARARKLARQAVRHYKAGDYAKAAKPAKDALGIRERLLGSGHPDVATSLAWLGLAYWRLDRYAEAEPLLKRALAIREKAHGRDHLYVAAALNALGRLRRSQSQYAEAEALFKRALTIREQKLGKDHPKVATVLRNLAQVYKSQGRTKEAKTLLERAQATSSRPPKK